MRMTKLYHPGGIFNDEKESPIVLYVQLLCLSAPSLCVTCCTVLTRIVVIVPAFVSIPAYVLITIVAALSALLARPPPGISPHASPHINNAILNTSPQTVLYSVAVRVFLDLGSRLQLAQRLDLRCGVAVDDIKVVLAFS
jgi:hypothetical protein